MEWIVTRPCSSRDKAKVSSHRSNAPANRFRLSEFMTGAAAKRKHVKVAIPGGKLAAGKAVAEHERGQRGDSGGAAVEQPSRQTYTVSRTARAVEGCGGALC